jgi:hypothetical protein
MERPNGAEILTTGNSFHVFIATKYVHIGIFDQDLYISTYISIQFARNIEIPNYQGLSQINVITQINSNYILPQTF